jgi:gliding motility-associated protein GldM
MGGGGKETPRQKMIGMMYLVLLALLAMNVSKEIIMAFVMLNNKMDKSISQVEKGNNSIEGDFQNALSTLNAAQKPNPKEIARVEALIQKNSDARGLIKTATNTVVFLQERMFIEAGHGPGLTRADLEGITVDHGHGEHPLEYIKKNEKGYWHLQDFSHFGKLDEYDTPTRLFVGDNFEVNTEDGQNLLDAFKNVRDSLLLLVSSHESKPDKDGKTVMYSFDPSLIEQPKFKTTPEEYNEFDSTITVLLNEQQKANKIDKKDKKVLKDIIVRLTLPLKTINHDEEYPFLAGIFDHAPIAGAAAAMTSMRGDIFGIETIVAQHFAKDINVVPFAFNKIEPLAFSSTSYINQGDSLALKVMIAAYDSSKTTELKYWLDDTIQYRTPEDSRDTSAMMRFTKKPTEFYKQLNISGSVGDHTMTGLIAVESATEGKKWKPWQFNYSVGAPNAAVSAADLQVLYRGWNNKIKVSASGYKPESIKISCSGCSITSSPDKDGNYIAKAPGGRGKEAFITVSAIDDNGKNVELTKERFRIFNLPKPTVYFGGKAGGSMKKVDAVQIPKLKAQLGESPLDVPYSVTSFVMLTVKNGQPIRLKSNGERLSGQMKAAIKKMAKGGTLTFTGVKVKGPSGKEQPLDAGLVLTLK